MAFLELLGRLRQTAREELTFMMVFFCASLIGVFAILIYIVSQVFGIAAGAGIMGATAALAVLNVEAEEEADDAIEAKSQEILASFSDRSRKRREWLLRRRARREGREEDEDSGTGSEPASPSSPTMLPEGSEPFFDDGSPLPSDISDLRATLQARLKALRNLEDEAGSKQKSSAEAGGDGEAAICQEAAEAAHQLRLKRLVAEMRERSADYKDFPRQHFPFITKAMRQHFGFLFPNSSLLVPALTCSFAAVYVVRRLRLQVQQLERLKADVPVAEDLEDLQPSGNESGTFEELASPSQQHLQQQLINVLSLLSLRDSFIALPAVSRSMHQIFQEEVFAGIRTNHLWPTERFPPVAPPVPPSEALHSPLEVLFLWSVRERWAGFSNAAEAPHRALQPKAGRKAPGPILWTLERFGWNDRGARALRAVLKWKADPDELDANRWTPLIWAAHLGCVVIGRLLLRAGANPDHIGAEGSSALSVACRSAHKEVVQLLLLNQASPYLVPIGNGNFDHHVGEEILEMVRQYRKLSTKRGSFVLSSS
ncbi:Ank1 [Symbiodinium sp. CCMP2592]|nr:Ank1 [Symbiodinium sp. CCMP2592]